MDSNFCGFSKFSGSFFLNFTNFLDPFFFLDFLNFLDSEFSNCSRLYCFSGF